MLKSITAILILFAFVSCNKKQNKTDKPSFFSDKNEVFEKIDNYINKYQKLDIFSGAVLIAESGNPVYRKAFGLANRDKKIPNTLNTKYLIGSMNKDFTRVVILQLISEGKLHWSDKMNDYLEGFSQKAAPEITIKQLVDHTSGFGDYESWDYEQLPYDEKNIHTILDLARKQELLFLPGTGNEYSNTGYVLLGAIIEKVTGKSYVQNVKERITVPLGMVHTYLSDIKLKKDRTIGYMKTINGIENTEIVISEPRPDGGFWCTPEDILLFYQNFFYGFNIIPEEIKETDPYFKMIAPLYFQPLASESMAGGTNGHNSVIEQLFKENISIIVLANMDEPVAENLSEGIKAILIGKEPQEPKLPTILSVYEAYKAHGTNYVKNNFEVLASNYFPGDPKDMIINQLGYQLMESGKMEEALELLKLNTELFPDVANCWDSYGEALLKKGDREESLKVYQKALSIKPDLKSAQAAVKKLQGN